MEQATNQQAYPGYGAFVLEQSNSYPHPNDPSPLWRIVATYDRQHYPQATVYSELAPAVEEVKARLQALQQRLLAQAAGCAEQLRRLDELYTPQLSPGQAIQAQRDQVVDCLRRFKAGENVGQVQFQGFKLALPYLHSNNVLVINLPEYDAISPRFLKEDIDQLSALVQEAGFQTFDLWNGAGHYTVSFRLPVKQAAAVGSVLAPA